MLIEDEIANAACRNGASAVCDRTHGLKLGVAGVLRVVELAVAAAVSRGMLTDAEVQRTRAHTRQLEAEAAAKRAAADAERERLRAEIDALDAQLAKTDAED